MYNIQYLQIIQCACFKEWRRECIRVCTLSRCCHFLLYEYFSSVVLILIHQSLSIFKALAGLASLCDVCYARCLIGIGVRGCSGHHQHIDGKCVWISRDRNLEQQRAENRVTKYYKKCGKIALLKVLFICTVLKKTNPWIRACTQLTSTSVRIMFCTYKSKKLAQPAWRIAQTRL